METTNVTFKVVKTNKEGLKSQSLTSGAVYFVTDTKEIYVDYDTTRTCFEDIIILENDNLRSSILFTPLNKFYYVVDTNKLWLYKDGTWIAVTSDLTNYQLKETAVTHTKTTAVGNTITPVYIAQDGSATALNFTIEKSVPSNANFENTTYTAGSGLSLSGTQFKHKNSITSGTIGTSSGTNGSTLSVPYVTYDTEGHITATGTRTHTVSGFLTSSDVTSVYNASGTSPVNGQAIKSAIDTAISSVYKPAGSIAFANRPTLSVSVLGNVYNITDDFTTTSDFVEGTGKNYPAGTNIVVINTGADQSPTYKFDVLSGIVDLTNYQLSETAVTHTKTTAVGNTIRPVYIASDGKATQISYTIAKSVPSDALFTDTTYSAGSGLSLSGTEFKHTNSITSGTQGTSTATSGSTLVVPYVTYDETGHISSAGTHTHTVTGFLTEHQSLNEYQKKETAVIHTKTTAVGNSITPVYIANDGTATQINYTIAKSVPSDAVFTDTTYTAGSGLSLNGKEFKHKNSITSATQGTSTATSGSTLVVPYVTYDTEGHISSAGTHTHTVTGFLTSHQSLADYQKKETAVTHTKTTAVGNTITPVYIATDGSATALSYTLAKSVPSDANFDNTTYTAGAGLTLTGTEFKHSNSVTSGTAGTSTASSGSTLSVPYVTYDTEGHITGKGNRTHTVTGFQSTDTAVTHTKTTAVGNTITPVYVASNGTATALSYTIAKSVPSDAIFTDTTYTAGSGLSLNGTEIKHKNSVTGATKGTSTATSGSTLVVPYITYDSEGHISAAGTHTHTVTGFLTSHQSLDNYYTKTEVDNKISTVYKASGSVAYASLPTPASTNVGNVYNVTDAFTTDNRFVEGASKSYPAGTNVVIIDAGSSTYKFDVLAGFVDLTNYQLSETSVTHTKNTAIGSTVKPVYVATDGKATALTATVGSTVKPVYLNSGAITAFSSNVGNTITPVYMNGGAITALSYTIAKSVPSNAVFTDTNNAVTNTLGTTTKAYITGTTSSTTNTGGQAFDTGVYLTTTAGKLNANEVSLGTENVSMQYNSTTKSIDFVFS